MFKLVKLWFKSAATKRKELHRRQSRAAQLNVEILEMRVMPVVGSLARAPRVSPGTNLDGVVQLVSVANGRGSGSELSNQTEILTGKPHFVVEGASADNSYI